MRYVSLALALAGFFLGVFASFLWLRASQIEPTPLWGDLEPMEPDVAQAGRLVGLLEASRKAGRLNGQAAILTGAAVFFTTLAGVVGLFV